MQQLEARAGQGGNKEKAQQLKARAELTKPKTEGCPAATGGQGNTGSNNYGQSRSALVEACFGTGAGQLPFTGPCRTQGRSGCRTLERQQLWTKQRRTCGARFGSGAGAAARSYTKGGWLQYARTTGGGADAQADAGRCGPHEGPCCKTRGLRAHPT